MPLLVMIIGPQAGTQFVDDSEFQHVSDGEFVFNDSLGVMRLSTEPFAGHRMWSDDILNIDPIAFRMDRPYGGMVKISGAGNVEITMAAFFNAGSAWWFPAADYDVVIKYTDSMEDTAITLLVGALYRNKINPPESVSFTLYPEDNSINLLSTATDYDGNTVVLPQAFGNVAYVVPVRLPDAGGGNRRYSAGGLLGTLGTDWHIYDDGVPVDGNGTAIVNNVFEYTVTPVGQLTISGYGVSYGAGQWDAFDYLCGTSYLNIPMTPYAAALNSAIDRWQDTQILVLDFLDLVAAAKECFFYILQGYLYLHVMNTSDYGTLTLDVNTDTLEGMQYEKTAPKSIGRYSFKKREAVEETIGKYIKETNIEVSEKTTFPYGEDITIDCMTHTRNTASSRILIALSYFIAQRGSLPLSLSSTLYRPGTRITLSDTRYTGATITSNPLHVRGIVYDFMSKKQTLEGEITTLTVT